MDSSEEVGDNLRILSHLHFAKAENSSGEKGQRLFDKEMDEREKQMVHIKERVHQHTKDNIRSAIQKNKQPGVLGSTLGNQTSEAAHVNQGYTKVQDEHVTIHGDAISPRRNCKLTADVHTTSAATSKSSRGLLTDAISSREADFGKTFSGYGPARINCQHQPSVQNTDDSHPQTFKQRASGDAYPRIKTHTERYQPYGQNDSGIQTVENKLGSTIRSTDKREKNGRNTVTFCDNINKQPVGIKIDNIIHSFSHQTPIESTFTKAVSHISNNRTSSDAGEVTTTTDISTDLLYQLHRALAEGVGLNRPHLDKQRALQNVLSSKAARCDMRQLLLARSEIYGDCIDPNLFVQNADIGGKANTISSRNKARAMLAGAPLMVAQLVSMKLREKLIQGNCSELSQLRMAITTTVSDLLTKLRAAPPLAVLKLCNPQLADFIQGMLVKLIDDLDFAQDVLSATANDTKLNPILNSVLAGFKRRCLFGRFKYGNYSLEVDKLRFLSTASSRDDDLCVEEIRNGLKNNPVERTGKRFLCHFYQQHNGCWKLQSQCGFLHQCAVCGSLSHGAYTCGLKMRNRQESTDSRGYRVRRNDESRKRRANKLTRSSRKKN